MENKILFKSLTGDVYTEMFLVDGKAIMNVYNSDGVLIDVFKEIAESKELDSENWFDTIYKWLVVSVTK